MSHFREYENPPDFRVISGGHENIWCFFRFFTQIRDAKTGNKIKPPENKIRVVALAWKAIIRLYRIWKNDNNITRDIKVNLFRATIESIFLYNATTWTMTKTLEKSLDGVYTKLLRYALEVKTNKEVYGNLFPVSIRLRQRRVIFNGHCFRSSQCYSELCLHFSVVCECACRCCSPYKSSKSGERFTGEDRYMRF